MFVYTATAITTDDTVNVTVHTTQDGALTHLATKAVAEADSHDWGTFEGQAVSFTEYVHDLTGGTVDNPIDVLVAWFGEMDESARGVITFGDGNNSLTIERTEVLA